MFGDNKKMVEEKTRELVLSTEQLQEMSSLLLHNFLKGLGKDTHDESKVKMFPTYVRDVPNGREQGKFLALDLGGTNFRVLLIELNKDDFKMTNEVYEVPQEIMHGTGVQLFDHIANCLANFIEKIQINYQKLPLGFTFSFPCKQLGLTSARLVTWTKGFKCSGVEGQDVVQLLREAVQRRGDIDIDVVGVVNDTTGTLMSCAHKNQECRVGVIVGTGCNACYMEKLSNVGTWNEESDEPPQVIINTEWGAFGDDGCIEFLRTEYDQQIDDESLNQGKQLFEKMISGMYMGELVRLIVLRLCKDGLLFGGIVSKHWRIPYNFHTQYVSSIESDKPQCYQKTREVLSELETPNATDEDCECLKLICARVSTRAAHLVSAAVATVLNKMQRPHTTVGVDGSVYRYHPYFHDLMVQKIREMTSSNYQFDLMLSEDGSGRGAALVAAVAVRMKT